MSQGLCSIFRLWCEIGSYRAFKKILWFFFFSFLLTPSHPLLLSHPISPRTSSNHFSNLVNVFLHAHTNTRRQITNARILNIYGFLSFKKWIHFCLLLLLKTISCVKSLSINWWSTNPFLSMAFQNVDIPIFVTFHLLMSMRRIYDMCVLPLEMLL